LQSWITGFKWIGKMIRDFEGKKNSFAVAKKVSVL
jgi:hypothetical protein